MRCQTRTPVNGKSELQNEGGFWQLAAAWVSAHSEAQGWGKRAPAPQPGAPCLLPREDDIAKLTPGFPRPHLPQRGRGAVGAAREGGSQQTKPQAWEMTDPM